MDEKYIKYKLASPKPTICFSNFQFIVERFLGGFVIYSCFRSWLGHAINGWPLVDATGARSYCLRLTDPF
jgi:hypothetical protein